ncbi:MAG: hypothetical protein ACYTG1_04250 [Planctomycetota bacterium]|jgi:hypothetical protein
MKQSRIKRLIPKKLARRVAGAGDDPALAALVERESADAIAKMRAKGYTLVTRLDTGEGIFVREDDVVGLHVQLPRSLYRRIETECKRREISKKKVVVEALLAHFERAEGGAGGA